MRQALRSAKFSNLVVLFVIVLLLDGTPSYIKYSSTKLARRSSAAHHSKLHLLKRYSGLSESDEEQLGVWD
jgi:hypothetical protein